MREKLESALWQAQDALRGVIELPEQVSCIFRLLVMKLLSEQAEEERSRAVSPYAVPGAARWDWLYGPPVDLGPQLNEACIELEEANPALKRVLTGFNFDGLLPGDRKGQDQLLFTLIQHLYGMPRFTGEVLASGALGEASEALFFRNADALGRRIGEFYTPPSINRLMVKLMDLRAGMRVCDPVCGVGSSLTECARQIGRSSPEDVGLVGALVLHGQEKNVERWALCRMNLMLHGIFTARIEAGDVLRKPLLLQDKQLIRYDRILADPPYNMDDWGAESAGNDPFGRFKPVPSKNSSDYAFLQHCMATLAEGGRAALLMPRSTLFRGGEEALIRRSLIEEDRFEAVIALPGNLYATTGIAPIVLILRRGKESAHRGRVLCIDASHLGVTERRQRFLREGDVKAIAQAFHRFEETAGFARAVSLEEVAENDWNLNVALYVRPEEQYVRRAPREQLAELAMLERERDESAQRMDAIIERLMSSGLLKG